MNNSEKFDYIYDIASSVISFFPPASVALAVLKPHIKSRIVSDIEFDRLNEMLDHFNIEVNDIKNKRNLEPRSDNIFEIHGKEIVEAIINTSKNNIEVKKQRFIGYLYANILFNSMNEIEIFSILKLINDLSFQQLVIIRLFNDFKSLIPKTSIYNNEINEENRLFSFKLNSSAKELFLLNSIKDLEKQYLLTYGISKSPRFFEIELNTYSLTGLGKLLYNEFNLQKIESEDVERILRCLQKPIENEKEKLDFYGMPSSYTINGGYLMEFNDLVFYQKIFKKDECRSSSLYIVLPISSKGEPIITINGIIKYKILSYCNDIQVKIDEEVNNDVYITVIFRRELF